MTRRNGYKARVIDTRQPRQRFLIVCEGAKTEPNYFNSFRVPMDVRVQVIGLGEDPLTLVRSAANFNEQDSYDQVWCVFDRDSWPQDKFDNAIKSARAKGFEIAYSNEAFELWYVLHYEFLDTGIPRAEYIAKMSVHLGKPYLKNSEDIYEVLLPLQPAAIRNAERLLGTYDPHYPGRDNPSTGVHKLVMELNKFLPR